MEVTDCNIVVAVASAFLVAPVVAALGVGAAKEVGGTIAKLGGHLVENGVKKWLDDFPPAAAPTLFLQP